MRIVAGHWRGRALQAPAGAATRPTADRVRQALFDSLWHAPWAGRGAVEGVAVLDAFAGTGALGFEAASRGATAVQLVENDPALVEQLHTLQQRLQALAVRVQRGDGVAALRHCAPGSLHLVFLDPPFDGALFEPALAAAAQAIAAQGFIYLEAPQAWDEAALAERGLAVHRHLKAGAVHAHLLRKQ